MRVGCCTSPRTPSGFEGQRIVSSAPGTPQSRSPTRWPRSLMSVWPAATPSRCANSALSGSPALLVAWSGIEFGVRRAARPDRRRVRKPARVRPGRTTRRRPARASPRCHTPLVARPGRGTTWTSTPLPQRHSVLRRRSPSRPCGPSGADLERLHPALAGGVPSSTALVLADAVALWTGRARLGRGVRGTAPDGAVAVRSGPAGAAGLAKTAPA